MTNVERQAEKMPENRSESQQISQHNAGAPAAKFRFKMRRVSSFWIADADSHGMLGDSIGKAIVDGEILAPAADEGGHPQNDACDSA